MAFNHGYALLIGVDTYRHVPQLNFPIAAEEITAIAGVLYDPGYCGYPLDQVKTLFGAAANRANILDSLDQLARRTQPEDTLILFHCGHGDYGTDGKYYLICHDTQIQGIKVAGGTGISDQELLEKVKSIPAQRLLLVFNPSHSGEISPSPGIEQSLGGKNLPGRLAEALLFTGSGRTVITACRENQRSWSGHEKRSIFTQAFVDSLQGKGISPIGGTISLFDLYAALYETVRRKAAQLVGQEQEPELTILEGVRPFAVGLYQGATQTDLGAAETVAEPLPALAVRQVNAERSQQVYQQLIHPSGGMNLGQDNQVEIKGDVTGGDRIDARETQGFVQHAAGPVEQRFDSRVNTGGGAYVRGNVNVQGGDFIGRDQISNAPSSSQTLTRDDFLALLEQIRAELSVAQLDGKARTMVEHEIDSIKEEAQDEKPSPPLIEARLNSIQSVIQKTAGVATATIGLAQIVQQAIQLAQSLFH
jgi:hypothetical protein